MVNTKHFSSLKIIINSIEKNYLPKKVLQQLVVQQYLKWIKLEKFNYVQMFKMSVFSVEFLKVYYCPTKNNNYHWTYYPMKRKVTVFVRTKLLS